MQRTRNACARSAAPFHSPSLIRFLEAKFAQSAKPTTTRTPVESSANSAPFTSANQQAEIPDTANPDRQQGVEFDPRGWAVHLKMLAKRGTLVSVAMAAVRKELRAPTRSPRSKANRPDKKALAIVAGGCA